MSFEGIAVRYVWPASGEWRGVRVSLAMSLMGSRSACRLASHYARWMGIQRAAGGDGWRLMMSRWLASASSSSNATATMPKVPKPQQPTVVVSQVSQTHTSAVLVPPQQTDGTKVAVKLEEEYPCDVAPVEIPTKNDLQQPLSESDQSDEAHFASRIEAFKMAENKSASAASSNLGRGERQAHTTTAARKNSVDKKETAKFAAIAATWYMCISFGFSFTFTRIRVSRFGSSYGHTGEFSLAPCGLIFIICIMHFLCMFEHHVAD